jgi:hypothetical protein
MARTRLLATVVRPQSWWLLCVSLLSVVGGSSAQSDSQVPSVEAIVARMAQARAKNQARFCPYVVTRDYKLFGKQRDKTKSQVVADVTFVPPAFKKYAIQQTNGTGLGEKIVRRMLEREVEIAKDYTSTDISLDNYAFDFVRQEDDSSHPCYVLRLIPKRKDKNLLLGTIWVDAVTYLLRRTEGEPAKPPSWWLRDVHIALVYGDVGGMWLQTASESRAKVRILGPHTMVSRDVSYQIGQLVVASSLGLNKPLKPLHDGSLRHREVPSSSKRFVGAGRLNIASTTRLQF